MTLTNARKKALEALLAFEQPDEFNAALTAFPWDSDAELVFLSAGHLKNVLSRFATGRASATEVEKWANAVEGRDDIGFERADMQRLRELVHELANPILTQPLTRERAVKLLTNISRGVDEK